MVKVALFFFLIGIEKCGDRKNLGLNVSKGSNVLFGPCLSNCA